MFETRELLEIRFALCRSIDFHEDIIKLADKEDDVEQWEMDLKEIIALNDKVLKLIGKSIVDKTVEVPREEVYAIIN